MVNLSCAISHKYMLHHSEEMTMGFPFYLTFAQVWVALTYVQTKTTTTNPLQLYERSVHLTTATAVPGVPRLDCVCKALHKL